MFSFFKRKADSPPAPADAAAGAATPSSDRPRTAMEWLNADVGELLFGKKPQAPDEAAAAAKESDEEAASRLEGATRAEVAADGEPVERSGWVDRLRSGLQRTGSGIADAFLGTAIDDTLYEDLESALLLSDAGAAATRWLLDDLQQRVTRADIRDPRAARRVLAACVEELLRPLERPLVIGEHMPTVIMVVGVNGAGKTTSVGKLARHLIDSGQKVLLAAADTFRAAAREQLLAWAERAGRPSGDAATPSIEIVSQQGGDPAGVSFDAVKAGQARGVDVVIADTAGRLATQAHLMEELKKVRRVIGKAQEGAPHEVVLVIDGNTGQNALTQVQAFDAALELTGLVVTKLDGTAKGGVLAAIALWQRSRVRPLPVYFIGIGEQLADLQTFRAAEFARALVG